MLAGVLNSAPSRYLIIGLGCAILNNAILIGADAIGAHYVTAILLTFAITLPLAYVAHAWWTFDVGVSWIAFGRFVAGSVSSLIIAGLTVGVFRGGLDMPMLYAAPLATVVMTVYNYVMARWAVGAKADPQQAFKA